VPYLNGVYPSTTISERGGEFVCRRGRRRLRARVDPQVHINSNGSATESVLHSFTAGAMDRRRWLLHWTEQEISYGLAYSTVIPNVIGELFELTPTAHGEWNRTVLETSR